MKQEGNFMRYCCERCLQQNKVKHQFKNAETCFLQRQRHKVDKEGRVSDDSVNNNAFCCATLAAVKKAEELRQQTHQCKIN